MSTQDPGSKPASPGLAALPRVEDLPTVEGGGYDAERVREAFETYRRQLTQLQAQLRVLQAAGASAQVEPTGHSVRMDALHLIRAAAEFADTLERDAQNASAAQIRRTEEEVRGRQTDLQQREADVERTRQESERQRAEIVNAAKAEARELVANAQRDASQELREAEAKGARLLEQSRHQATELTNAARAEVEQTLEWARAQAAAILQRAQQGTEQLLRAAGLGDDAIGEVAAAIIRAAEETFGTTRAAEPEHRPTAAVLATPPAEPPPAPPVSGPPPVAPPPVVPPGEAAAPPPPPLTSEPPVSGRPPGGPPEESSFPEGPSGEEHEGDEGEDREPST